MISLLQEFLTADFDQSQPEPSWLTMYGAKSELWLAVETRLVPPATVPISLQGARAGLLLEILKFVDPLETALRRGTFLTVGELQHLVKSSGAAADLPRKGGGSGKGGRLTKIDWARCLIAHVCGGASEEEMCEAQWGSRV